MNQMDIQLMKHIHLISFIWHYNSLVRLGWFQEQILSKSAIKNKLVQCLCLFTAADTTIYSFIVWQ